MYIVIYRQSIKRGKQKLKNNKQTKAEKAVNTNVKKKIKNAHLN